MISIFMGTSWEGEQVDLRPVFSLFGSGMGSFDLDGPQWPEAGCGGTGADSMPTSVMFHQVCWAGQVRAG
ncbi:hypothetical protein [Streptomyces atrovirens]|uniref:Uncharacterized protein n=1 Tax=Streptomyces atrovirens TaxID=285556 RepID=A0ABW0DY41_9ACTN